MRSEIARGARRGGRGEPVGIEPAWTRPLRVALRVVATRSMRSAAARAVPPSAAAAGRLSGIASTFLHGYRAALEGGAPADLASRLAAIDAADRGFAFEGASMALALLDALIPGRERRFDRFLLGPADAHRYMAHVGAGWAAARLRRPPDAVRRGLDPLLGWLAVDGYGFHQGYFHPHTRLAGGLTTAGASGYTLRVLDQGLGRSLWFSAGADPDRLARTLSAFPAARRADLWSGVALAAAYAGGASVEGLRALKAHAAGYDRQLAQGVAFAAEARHRAGNPAPHTEAACAILAGIGASSAARAARDLARVARDGREGPAYEDWRRRVGAAIAGGE